MECWKLKVGGHKGDKVCQVKRISIKVFQKEANV